MGLKDESFSARARYALYGGVVLAATATGVVLHPNEPTDIPRSDAHPNTSQQNTFTRRSGEQQTLGGKACDNLTPPPGTAFAEFDVQLSGHSTQTIDLNTSAQIAGHKLDMDKDPLGDTNTFEATLANYSDKTQLVPLCVEVSTRDRKFSYDIHAGDDPTPETPNFQPPTFLNPTTDPYANTGAYLTEHDKPLPDTHVPGRPAGSTHAEYVFMYYPQNAGEDAPTSQLVTVRAVSAASLPVGS